MFSIADMSFLQWVLDRLESKRFGQRVIFEDKTLFVELDRLDQFCSLLGILIFVSVRLTPQCFRLELELLEGRSCAALFVPKLTTWLAPAHVCSLACSWPWPARRCSASWAPLPVLQEALR